MDFKAILKTRKGRLTIAGIVLGMGLLCVVGVLPTLGVLGEGQLPEISLAAEEIPLPFSVPLFGDPVWRPHSKHAAGHLADDDHPRRRRAGLQERSP